MSRAPSRVLLAAAIVLTAACDDDPVRPIVLTESTFVVSEAGFVSMEPGRAPDARVAEIRSLRGSTGAAFIALEDGGFDPMTFPARVGDILTVRLSGESGQVTEYNVSVPPRRRPVVIRTTPPRGKKGVPLNAFLSVVFSEPVRIGSIGGIRLAAGSNVVPTTVQLSSDGLRVEITPSQSLDPNTEHSLIVPTEVTDLDGDSLEQEVVVPFTTGDSEAAAFVQTTQAALFHAPSNNALRSFVMNAWLRRDGKFEGTFDIFFPESGGGASGRVTCFTIVGDGQAWAAGVIERARNAALIGTEIGWRMIDLAAPDEPDRLTQALYLEPAAWGSATDYCAATPNSGPTGQALPLHALISGKLVVRGRTPPPTAVDLLVGVTTSGSNLDTDGYTLRIGPLQRDVPPTSTFKVLGFPAGMHAISVTGVASNCAASHSESRTATPGQGIGVFVQVSCYGAENAFVVRTTTTGESLDPDGYIVANATRPRVAINDSVVLYSRYTPFTVHLTDVAANCSVLGKNPREVAGVPGSPGEARFEITCERATLLALAGTPTDSKNSDIYTVTSGGAELTRLTTHASIDDEPAWSPDGTKIAFRSERDGNAEIYVMNADGTGQTRLTNSSSADYHPTWSPDGARIAFVSERDGNADIHVMDADGGNVHRLTNHASRDAGPDWSPVGDRIAFHSERDGNSEIYSMKSDGSDQRRLTTNDAADTEPVWSPDGTRIAFSRIEPCEEESWGTWPCAQGHIIDADGVSVGSVPWIADSWTDGMAITRTAWSPRGDRVAFGIEYCINDLGDCHHRSAIWVSSFATDPQTRAIIDTDVDMPGSMVVRHPTWRRK